MRPKTDFKYPLSIEKVGKALTLFSDITKYTSYKKGTFNFLNQEKDFVGNINWNYNKYGKLWAYNLNYFDFLLQEDIGKETGYKLINNYIKNLNQNSVGLEPYPISLRGINWIKFISKHNIKNNIDKSLYNQYDLLGQSLEYHLLGNYLLENGFSLLFGACYFNSLKFFRKAKKIIVQELD